MVEKYKVQIPNGKVLHGVLRGYFTLDEVTEIKQIIRDDVDKASDIILNLFPVVTSKKGLIIPSLPNEIPDYNSYEMIQHVDIDSEGFEITKTERERIPINSLEEILDYYVNVNKKYIPGTCGCLGPKGEALCPCGMRNRGIVIHGITFQISMDTDHSLKLLPLHYTNNLKFSEINGEAMDGLQFNIYSQTVDGKQKLVAFI